MNIYKISQTKNNDYGTFDSAIVVAETEEEARYIHPSPYADPKWWEGLIFAADYAGIDTWCHPDDVKIECIGTTFTQEKGVILASFNAG